MRTTLLSLLVIGGVTAIVTWPADNDSTQPRASTTTTTAEAQMIDRLRDMARPSPVIVTADLMRPTSIANVAPAPIAAPEPVAAAAEKLVVVPPGLNVRSEPSRDGAVLTQLLQGQSVDVADRKDGWVRVAATDGTVGWVSGKFLAEAH